MKTSLSNTNYSAGILLYRIRNGAPEFLLGRDVKYESWSDFGGKHDNCDYKQPLNTAVREFYEETCGIILNTYDMIKKINQRSVRIQCLSYKKKTYYMYVVKYDNEIDIEVIFKDQFDFLQQSKVCSKFREKSEIKWFGIDSIVNDKQNIRGVFYNSFLYNLEEIRRVTV